MLEFQTYFSGFVQVLIFS